MKCRLTREREVHEAIAPPELIAQCERRGNFLFAPVGTLIDDQQAAMLVLMGVAEAADDECAAATVRTPEQIEAAKTALVKLEARIDPADFAAFDAGEMIGYDVDGNIVPGPNAKPKPTEEESEI
mgnify:CR=1 FL=1